MGAVNYSTSDVITLGVKPYDLDDLDDLDDLTHDERAAYIADDYAASYADKRDARPVNNLVIFR